MSKGYCFGCMEQISSYPCPRCAYSPTQNASPYVLPPGTILNGKYLVGKVLGQGGFGITYIGMDLQLQRRVAIKEYYPSGCASRKTGTSHVIWYTGEAAQQAMLSGQEAFLKEARKMSKVSDIPAVVQVFNVFQENGTAYICMDFIEGSTLQQLLRQTGPLSWAQTRAIFIPVISAMDQVHRLGLVHRDLSPDNLMIQHTGHVKILDLGAAKDLSLNSGKSSMQVAKNGFSPLEQYVTSGESGSWTDVYAMAATMYYTLTGVMLPSAIDRMNSDTLRWDLPKLQALPPEVCRALQHALAVRREDRTQTMEAFLLELQGQTVVTAKPKKFPKKAVLAAVAAVAVAAVIAGASFLFSGKDSPFGGMPGHGNPAASDTDAWQEIIEKRIEAYDRETYDYMNGTRMELYFDEADNERLRIYVNEDGKDEFVFLADYDEEGNIREEHGFESQELMRSKFWKRNKDGKITEIAEYAGETLLEKTEIHYDSQGRETDRNGVDGDGNVILTSTSTYNASGEQTRTDTEENGDITIYTYSEDGDLEETITTDADGKQLSHYAYRYDSDGNQVEFLSYNEKGEVTHRNEYYYEGDKRIGYTSYSVNPDGKEFHSECKEIHGPKDTYFGSANEYDTYTYTMEYVRDMAGSWSRLNFMQYTGSRESTTVMYYDWDSVNTESRSYDKNGKLENKNKILYDENGHQTGTNVFSYNDDGSYSVSLVVDSKVLSRDEYTSDFKLKKKTEYQYDANGVRTGVVDLEYNEDGSYTREEMDADYHVVASWTYDSADNLVSTAEYTYNSSGTRTKSVLTIYYHDGSYTVTVKEGSKTVSEKTYDANGKLIS